MQYELSGRFAGQLQLAPYVEVRVSDVSVA